MKLIFDRQEKRQTMINSIIEDLRKQSGKEQSAFLIQEKPVKDKLEMRMIHGLDCRQIMLEIRFMLNNKEYSEVLELYELIGVENEFI